MLYDGRGNGRSDRPRGPEAYTDRELAADALAVMDGTDTDQVVALGLCSATKAIALLAAEHGGMSA